MSSVSSRIQSVCFRNIYSKATFLIHFTFHSLDNRFLWSVNFRYKSQILDVHNLFFYEYQGSVFILNLGKDHDKLYCHLEIFWNTNKNKLYNFLKRLNIAHKCQYSCLSVHRLKKLLSLWQLFTYTKYITVPRNLSIVTDNSGE